MDNYDFIYKSFLLVSTISFSISFFFSGSVAYNSMLSGYIGLLFALFMLILRLTGSNQNENNNVIFTIITKYPPFLFLIGVVIFIITLITSHKDTILGDHVPYAYNTYNNIAMIIFIYQMFILFNFDFSQLSYPYFTSSLSTLIILLCYVKIYIIFKYFTTDGFLV